MNRTRIAVALLMSAAALGGETATPFLASPPRTHTERIAGPRAEYRVEVGGHLDMDNTMTRDHAGRRIAFQNNVSLTIANTGGGVVRNPRYRVAGTHRFVLRIREKGD